MSCIVCFDLGVSSATDYEYKFWGLNRGTFTLCESESCDRRLVVETQIFFEAVSHSMNTWFIHSLIKQKWECSGQAQEGYGHTYIH